MEVTLTGSVVIQESRQYIGRPITLAGTDDMGWIQRPTVDMLKSLSSQAGVDMTLNFQSYNPLIPAWGPIHPTLHFRVKFRFTEASVLDLEPVHHWGSPESTTWFKVKGLKFTEVTETAINPCTANKSFTVSGLSGTFLIGETVTGGTSGAIGTVMGFTNPTLSLYEESGVFSIGETVTGPSGSAQIA
jgi:hypothetical protein